MGVREGEEERGREGKGGEVMRLTDCQRGR